MTDLRGRALAAYRELESVRVERETVREMGEREALALRLKGVLDVDPAVITFAGQTAWVEGLAFSFRPDAGSRVLSQEPPAWKPRLFRAGRKCRVLRSRAAALARRDRKSQSQFLCTGCGHSANADENAARIISMRAGRPVMPPNVSPLDHRAARAGTSSLALAASS